MRMFEIAEELEDTYLDEKVIKPMNSSSAVVLPETSPTHIEYRYALGRGVGVMDNIRRRLEDGVLPIYHSEMTDDEHRLPQHVVRVARRNASERANGAGARTT